MHADTAVEFVTHNWLDRKLALGPTTQIQDGGPGPLLRKNRANYYHGTRISTDGTTIYSYTTPLLTIIDATPTTEMYVRPLAYYLDKDYSRTTARQIRIINRILAARRITIAAR